MKKFILLFLVISIHTVAYNQVIKGTVSDFKDHSRINFAYIYFNGTFVGTNSDKNGYFDPSSVSWQGEMSLKRIADWLPYEYEVK